MQIKLVLSGKLHEPYKSIVSDYTKRIKRFNNFEVLEFKEKVFDEKILQLKKQGYKLCLLDEKGKEFSSQELANFILKHETQSQDLLFAIGPADGHSDTLKEKADCFIALSKLTLMHEIAALVFAEALYRAISINKNLPYHRN